MPFVAETADGLVVPEEVGADARPTCRECGDELRVRQSHEREGTFVARHFYHPNGGGSCSGGESAIHRRMKSIALSKVKQLFPYGEAGLEKKIGQNIADVYASFGDSIGKFGDGVVIEIQHKNKDKDIEKTSVNYLRNGFSVCWVSTDQLDGQDIDLADPDWQYAGNFHWGASQEEDHRAARDPTKPSCRSCLVENTLQKVAREHVYKGGQVYQCEQCGEYYVKTGARFERVAHEGNLSVGESRQYF